MKASGRTIARVLWLEGQVKAQEAWLAQCGGDLAGYVQHYGDPGLDHCYGDGGTAIYKADAGHLEELKLRLAKARAKSRPKAAP